METAILLGNEQNMENRVRAYIEIAQRAEVFKLPEIEVLKEVLYDFKSSPGFNYITFDENVNGDIVGFIIFGKTPLTSVTWDIYWLAVDKQYQGKGYGKKLIKRVEEFVEQQQGPHVLRVETSTRKEYAHARNLYLRMKYSEAGRILDFYEPGDDLVIFYKKIDNSKVVPAQ